MTLKASIDIGTNSTRLLIVRCLAGNKLSPVAHVERLTKLGDGLGSAGELSRKAMQRVIDALREYRAILSEKQVADVRVFATSATRDAGNRDDFLSLIKRQTGFECRLLSGEEEARLSFLGVVSDMHIAEPCLVCDVGGGSTEFIFARGKEILFLQSLNIGSGRLTRQFLHTDPPTSDEMDSAAKFVVSQLKTFEEPVNIIVGVGGTAATLALIDAKASIKDAAAAHHYRLAGVDVERIVAMLARMPVQERRFVPGLHPERADVIVGGGVIFREILRYFRADVLTTSLRDLMYGIFLE